MLRRETSVKWIVIALIALILITALGLLANFKKDVTYVQVGNQSVTARLADTPEEREKGLSGTRELKPNEGMLFIFDKPDTWGIWMKEMNYKIDVLWIDEDNKIVAIERNVSPETYPKIFNPDKKAKYILEVPAGFADRADAGLYTIVSFRSWLW